MVKKQIKTLFLILLSMAVSKTYSQAGEEDTPYSFTNSLGSGQIRSLVVGNLSNDSLNIADSANQVNTDSVNYSYSFATSIKVNKDLLSAMTWDTVQNQIAVGRIKLTSLSAFSSFLIFNDFFLPAGVRLYAYNESRTQVLGAFTAKNNKPYGRFSLGPIVGESIILEIVKPLNVTSSTLNLHLASYVHAYKKVFNHIVDKDGNPTYGGSDSCNINVMCPVPLIQWCNQRRSVALIVKLNPNSHFVSMCTGALVNNEKSDYRPYLLTAAHCTLNENVNDWIFIFNYQTQNCANPSSAPNVVYTISGSVLRSRRCKSDFALLELSQRPPGNFNTYYSGWDNEDKRPENGASITHPRGDVKKIAFFEKKAKRKTPTYGSECKNVKSWEVKWTSGTVEPGSSGGPLFNSNGLIVGQVYGGIPSLICTNNDKPDFGRFDISWAEGNNSTDRLRDWLNPNGTSNLYIQSIGGVDACKSGYSFSNASDLHTSANVNGMPPFTNPLPGTRTYDGVYMASGSIQAGQNVTILSSTTVKFLASEIVLSSGFTASSGADFLASIQPCKAGCFNDVGRMKDNNEGDDLFVIANKTDVSRDDNYVEESIMPSNEILIFPNPSSGKYSVLTTTKVSECYSIKIFDKIGRVVYSQEDILTPQTNIDLSSESKGVYLVHIVHNGITSFKKIILQ